MDHLGCFAVSSDRCEDVISRHCYAIEAHLNFQVRYREMDSYPSAFSNYSTPHHSTLYSASYFVELTFKQVATLVLPPIYEPNSIAAWTFTDEIPAEAHSKVELGEGIPDLDDLRPILQQMEQAFSGGSRSVAVSLVVAEKHIDKLYHLSKVCTFSFPLNG